MAKKDSNQNVRVGIFVLIALGVLIAVIFTIGQERSMFTSKTKLRTSFPDINGLVIGAPVRLAGVDVGRVTRIEFAESLEHPEALVELSVENRYLPRVRKDSRAYIDSKGLLGDKLINVTVGSPKQPPLEEGGYLQPRASMSIEGMAKELESTASAIGRAAQTAEGAVSGLVTPELTQDLQSVVRSLASILGAVERGDGVAHRLIYDDAAARDLSRTLENLASTSARANSAMARVDRALARVEQGPGTLHALLYEAEGEGLIREWTRAGTGIADTAHALNHGDGLASALLRDEEGRKLLTELTELSSRLNHIASEVEKGRGTLGGLLIDPSVYEEMKTVLGNIERSTILKALIRMTIKEESIARPPTTVRAPTP